MSKLYDQYQLLKAKNNQKMYLFKNGIFYIFLEEDAQRMSLKFNFKLTHLNDTIVKCGFPVSSYPKYQILFDQENLDIEVVDNIADSLESLRCILEFAKEIENMDLVHTSPMTIYNRVVKLKEQLKNE